MKIEKFTNKDDWLDRRKDFITGTKLSVILGLNSYTSLKNIDNDNFKGNSYSIAGQILEPAAVNAANYILDEEFELFCPPEYPYILCFSNGIASTPDAISKNGLKDLEDGKEVECLLECKTTKNIDKWKICPPIEYLCQIYAQMLSTDIKKCKIIGCSTDFTQKGGVDYIHNGYIYELKRTDKLDDLILTEINKYLKDKTTFKVSIFAPTLIKYELTQEVTKIYGI